MAEPPSARPRALGSKSRSFMPMTPRNVKHNFTHQAGSTTTQVSDGQPPQKKLKSSSAPKGSKIASGYADRAAQLRAQEAEEDNTQKRLKELEQLLKKEEITQEIFEREREALGIGGDLRSTHLVKGLDFRLLEKVRRGDDLDQTPKAPVEEQEEVFEVLDEAVDEEFEKALAAESTARANSPSNQDNEGEIQQPSSNEPQTSLSRDEILRRYRQSRGQPTSPELAQPALDQSRFRKLDPGPKKSKHKFTETINGRRREVLLITQKDGTTKRKTRWLDPEHDPESVASDKAAVGHVKPSAWGADLDEGVLARQKAAAEEAARQKEKEDEDDDGDIFGNVAEYDPLAGIESDNEDDANGQTTREEQLAEMPETHVETEDANTRSKPLKSTNKRNYFSSTNDADEDTTRNDPKHDPSILAALKRAAQIRRQDDEGEENGTEGDPSKPPKSAEELDNDQRNRALLKKLQQNSGQDDLDLDMGFGGDGRFDDDDDEGRQKLSEWKGASIGGEEPDDEETLAAGDGKAKHKRGGKKKKGDKNSFADVMSVIEGRKK